MKINILNLPREILTFSLILLASFGSSQVFAVECGATIIKPRVLTQDLNCELTAENPVALTVIGPFGSLILEDAEISCSIQIPFEMQSFGIVLKGASASVSGGKISGCENGISAEDHGTHSISNIEIIDFDRDGIRLASGTNTVTNVMLTGLAGSTNADGIMIAGSNNNINNCMISGIGDEGIEVGGNYNSVTFCHISGFNEEGIEIIGDYSNIAQNVIEHNLENGIRVNGDFATVGQNVVRSNAEIGIEIDNTVGSRITQNTVIENGSNLSEGFGGIVVTDEAAAGNQIIGNIVFDNEPYDLSDLFDPDCTGTNIWEGNRFGSANPGCLN
ncbi:right-handed parallel beta-helix repeat-containing protein [Microbulbifer sp. MLAF003]|uniref:right-handed parallel beta-helix repeat-containing protein n=1 Tax=unclassified Microbulbifer TaxID=2619833 RepID=UPI0024ACFC68|nr:right-handed parallel beta-helix repeat-containing protein [Microbulbifer sp. MLAF003]WHI52801.1 right-handed parallel beta-helix repeat-containing protein [Microbulbifer sp. MLAF003]